MCDGHGLRDEAEASRYLPMEGSERSQDAVRELVRLGRGDEARTGELLELLLRRSRVTWEGPGPLDPRSNDRLHGGGPQQTVLGSQAQAPRVAKSKNMSGMLYLVAKKRTPTSY